MSSFQSQKGYKQTEIGVIPEDWQCIEIGQLNPLADAGDIVIACSGISVDKFDEKVAILEAWHLPLCMNTSTMRFKVMPDKIDKFYLQHFLRSGTFKEQIGGKATGSAQLNFGPSHVNAVKLKLPDIAEQNAIATILSDMDTAITVLEEKLTKTRQLKQGMMHQLLTGKIRLLEDHFNES